MSAPIHSASPRCQRSGAWRHKQRERQKKMRACGGHPGRGREALEEQRLRGHKRRGEDGRTKKKKKSCFSKDHLGIFLHRNSGDGTRGPTSEWGSLLTLHGNRLPAADRVCFQLCQTVSGNSRTNHLHLFWIKMPKEGLTAGNNCSKEYSG